MLSFLSDAIEADEVPADIAPLANVGPEALDALSALEYKADDDYRLRLGAEMPTIPLGTRDGSSDRFKTLVYGLLDRPDREQARRAARTLDAFTLGAVRSSRRGGFGGTDDERTNFSVYSVYRLWVLDVLADVGDEEEAKDARERSDLLIRQMRSLELPSAGDVP